MSYAAVPLYRAFCAATGFAGTPQVGTGKFAPERLVAVEGDRSRRIKVHFNADTSDALPWQFVPQQKFVAVQPGETALAFYRAKNTSSTDVIGIATYNVTPDRVRGLNENVNDLLMNDSRRSRPISRRWSVSALTSRSCSLAKRWTCLCCSSSTKTYSTTRHVRPSMTWFYLTLSSGMSRSFAFSLIYGLDCSARRNSRGQLEPDAPDDVVQASLGFDEFEHAPKVEDRKPPSDTS